MFTRFTNNERSYPAFDDHVNSYRKTLKVKANDIKFSQSYLFSLLNSPMLVLQNVYDTHHTSIAFEIYIFFYGDQP